MGFTRGGAEKASRSLPETSESGQSTQAARQRPGRTRRLPANKGLRHRCPCSDSRAASAATEVPHPNDGDIVGVVDFVVGPAREDPAVPSSCRWCISEPRPTQC